VLERQAAAREPGAHPVFGEGVQVDDGAAPVVDVLAPVHEVVRLELRGQLAGSGERQAELACELTDRPLAFGADVRQHGDVPAPERRLPLDELEQLGCGPPPGPEAAHHPPQQAAQLAQLVCAGPVGNSVASVIVIIR